MSDKLLLSVSRNGYIVEHNSTIVSHKRISKKSEAKKDALSSLYSGLVFCKTLCNHDTTLAIQTDITFISDHLSSDVKKPISYLDEINRCARILDDCDATISFVTTNPGLTKADVYFKSLPVDALPAVESFSTLDSLLSLVDED